MIISGNVKLISIHMYIISLIVSSNICLHIRTYMYYIHSVYTCTCVCVLHVYTYRIGTKDV